MPITVLISHKSSEPNNVLGWMYNLITSFDNFGIWGCAKKVRNKGRISLKGMDNGALIPFYW